jgi:hypothetical protein
VEKAQQKQEKVLHQSKKAYGNVGNSKFYDRNFVTPDALHDR